MQWEPEMVTVQVEGAEGMGRVQVGARAERMGRVQ